MIRMMKSFGRYLLPRWLVQHRELKQKSRDAVESADLFGDELRRRLNRVQTDIQIRRAR